MQKMVDVYVPGGVHERACSAADLKVVVLAGEVCRDLGHVGGPVNFCVWWGGRLMDVIEVGAGGVGKWGRGVVTWHFKKDGYGEDGVEGNE